PTSLLGHGHRGRPKSTPVWVGPEICGDVQFPPLSQGAARQTFASSSVIRLRKASCAILRATAPANAPAAAATSGLVWNSETPWVPTSTARIAPDSAIDEKPRNQVTNLETTASWSAGLGLRALSLDTTVPYPP